MNPPIEMLNSCTFARAIILHAIGYSVRRAAWPVGMHVRQDFQLREPHGSFLASLREWDPTTDDMEAADWEVDQAVPKIDRIAEREAALGAL